VGNPEHKASYTMSMAKKTGSENMQKKFKMYEVSRCIKSLI